MVDLVLRPSSLSTNPRVRWALQLRYHESCGETEYVTLCRIGDAAAQEIVRAGAPYWLFHGPTARPDWQTELDRLEPDEMSVDEMKLEIARLRGILARPNNTQAFAGLPSLSSAHCEAASERQEDAPEA